MSQPFCMAPITLWHYARGVCAQATYFRRPAKDNGSPSRCACTIDTLSHKRETRAFLQATSPSPEVVPCVESCPLYIVSPSRCKEWRRRSSSIKLLSPMVQISKLSCFRDFPGIKASPAKAAEPEPIGKSENWRPSLLVTRNCYIAT